MATKSPSPKPSKKATSKPPKKEPVFVFPDGSRVGVKDLGKVKPTPKPKPKATMKMPTGGTMDMNSQQYDAYLKKVIRDMKKGR